MLIVIGTMVSAISGGEVRSALAAIEFQVGGTGPENRSARHAPRTFDSRSTLPPGIHYCKRHTLWTLGSALLMQGFFLFSLESGC